MNTMTGLTGGEARQLLQKVGPNSVALEKRRAPIMLFLDTFKSPLVILLLGSSLISAYFGDIESFVIIAVIVLLSSLLDFYNTFKSDKAAQKLKDHIRLTATVIRDRERQEIKVEHIVPGDLVCLAAGDILPADGVIVEAKHFFVNESSLTGESFPQTKGQDMQVFMGSSVISGEACIRVTATGRGTQFSKVVADLSKQSQPTEFDREIRAFSFLVVRITMALVVGIFTFDLIFKHGILESFMFAVALAVSVTPELLPMIITMNLTRGSLVMAKHGVIVKRLSAIQNFGSMDILCTDKTGTLTEDEIALVQYVDLHGNTSEEALKYAYVNSIYTTGFHNPLDEAVKKFRHIPTKGCKKIDEIPFDFQRKRESIVADMNVKRVLIAKGAPEEIFKICQTPRAHWQPTAERTYHKLSAGGFRVLAIAIREVERQANYGMEDESNLTFMGFIAFLDPPKTDVARTLEHMHEYGVQVKIVTGDNELITERIATDISLKYEKVLLGTQVEEMSDEELLRHLPHTTIFARVNPEEKLRIIQSYQKLGHVVGYMGDGINDAPSLKAADVGISVNNAVDIAKESADLILMHKSLDDLIDGVIEGRKTFANSLKYLMMVLSSNFGNAFSMSIASLIIPFLPLLPTQILLNNLIYDTSQLTLPGDRVDDDEVRSPQRFDIQKVKRFMLVFGPVSSVFDIVTFGVLLLVFHFGEAKFQTGWFIESLATQILVVYVIRTKKIPFLQSRPSQPLLVGTLIMLAVGWLIALTGVGHYFLFTPLAVGPLVAISLIVLAYLVLAELTKRWFFQRWQGGIS